MHAILALLVVLGGADAETTRSGEAKKALKKAVKYKSYTFEGKIVSEGMGGRGGERGGGRPGGGQPGGGGGMPPNAGRPGEEEPQAEESPNVEGKYARRPGLHLKQPDLEAVKAGKLIAYKSEGRWKKFEPSNNNNNNNNGGGFGGRGGRGGRGNWQQAQEEEKIKKLLAPHEELLLILNGINEETGEEDDGEDKVYSVSLNPGVVEKLSPAGGMIPRLEDSTSYGTAKIWVDKDGQLVKYELMTEITGTMREREMNMKSTKTIELKDINKTKYKFPKAAISALLK